MAQESRKVEVKFVSLRDACEMGYGKMNTLRKAVREGALPGYMVGGRIKFKPEDLDAYAVRIPVKNPAGKEA